MKTQLIKLAENIEVRPTEDTQFVLEFPQTTTSEKYSINVIFEKPGVSGEIIGIYSLHNREQVDLTTISTHKAPNTTCLTRIKGALYDGAKSKSDKHFYVFRPLKA